MQTQPNSAPGPLLTREQLDAILQYDTCTIANAIEWFRVRLRNEGVSGPGLRCVTGGFARALGYAATFRIRTADPPMRGDDSFINRTDWWAELKRHPLPTIAVVEDIDAEPGLGSFAGEVHASILRALGCCGVITNGAVRDLPAVNAMDFPFFAKSVAVSHAYSHVVEFGKPVRIFGLEVHPGELIYADCHGAVTIPQAIAGKVADVAATLREAELRVIRACQSPDFTEAMLLETLDKNL